jgi:uncharacterized protein YqjF (DUF2071 family)
MMRTYRYLFAVAAAYNVLFGLWAGLFPRSFFTLFNLDAPRYPSIWACLGMVVGVYALAYAHVARHPERGTLLVAIGLLGKVLGPLGWLAAVASGELPPRTFPLILANDLLWWFPFLFYFVCGLPARRRIIAWVGVAVHVVASLALLAAAGGTEVVPAMDQRLIWVGEHPAGWAFTWTAWALASMSLSAFAVVWTAELRERGAPRRWVVPACLIVVLGLVFDLVGETVNLVWLTRPGLTVEAFARGARLYAILSAGTANGLYCIGGLVLSAVSWRSGWLRGWIGVLGMAMWGVGLALTVMVILDLGTGMIVTGAGVMVLYIPWATLVGWKMSRPQAAEWSGSLMHPALRRVDHRPWRLPPGRWTWRQSWYDILFAHWPVPAARLRPLVPDSLRVQEFDGTSWVGVVPFRMAGVMPRPFPDLPWVSAFPELNLRLYVERDGKPGVWFLSLDATNALAVWAARRFFHLPYYRARIDFSAGPDGFRFRSDRVGKGPAVGFAATYRPASEPFAARPGSLEAFLVERYCLYARSPDGRLFRAEVHHVPWPLQRAEGEVHAEELLKPHGLPAGPGSPILHFSRGVDAVVWPLERVS